MIVELTPEEKLVIVEQHMKNLLYSEYNLRVSLIEMGSNNETTTANVDVVNKQMQNLSVQKDALVKEADSLQALINAEVKKA